MNRESYNKVCGYSAILVCSDHSRRIWKRWAYCAFASGAIYSTAFCAASPSEAYFQRRTNGAIQEQSLGIIVDLESNSELKGLMQVTAGVWLVALGVIVANFFVCLSTYSSARGDRMACCLPYRYHISPIYRGCVCTNWELAGFWAFRPGAPQLIDICTPAGLRTSHRNCSLQPSLAYSTFSLVTYLFVSRWRLFLWSRSHLTAILAMRQQKQEMWSWPHLLVVQLNRRRKRMNLFILRCHQRVSRKMNDRNMSLSWRIPPISIKWRTQENK